MAGLTGSVCVVLIYQRRRWFFQKEPIEILIVSWNREVAYTMLCSWMDMKLGTSTKNIEGLRFKLARNEEYDKYRWEYFDETIKDC